MPYTTIDPAGAVYVGRPSKWGNPWAVGPSMSRHEAVELYEDWVLRMIERGALDIGELEGKNLYCPGCRGTSPCHADVLIELANPPAEQVQ